MPGEVFKSSVTVRFSHCDPAGIVFFPRYFEMINGVVEDWLAQALDWPFAYMINERNEGLPTVDVQCRFMHPSRLGDVLDFELSVAALGRSSCRLNIAAYKKTVAVLEATHVLVCVSHAGEHSSVEIPPPLRQRMAVYLTGEPAALKQ